jgi:nucleoside-diphosphate-sugar epimerase
MRVLVTGHDGYIGTVLVPILQDAGHDVVGLDNFLFRGCGLDEGPSLPALDHDVRDVGPSMLDGFDAVIHLAAISNDPMGDLDESWTYAINHRASLKLAVAAKVAGVKRFIFSSSCSLYGAADPHVSLNESAAFNPVTAYGRSKVLVEKDVAVLADSVFSPTYLRNATVYGVSPRLRSDLVVNNLVGYALTTGKILMMSDGTPWRPLVHVEDVARTFLAVLEAPKELVHNEAFNVGRNDQNLQIQDIAESVAAHISGTKVSFAESAGPDERCYKVDFSKLAAAFPNLQMRWTVDRGIDELAGAYSTHGLTLDEFLGPRFVRLSRLSQLIQEDRLDSRLRWRDQSNKNGRVPAAL